MCAYNKINGPYACENQPLLEDILRGDWGFEGLTIADYTAAHDTGALPDRRARHRAVARGRLRLGLRQRRSGDGRGDDGRRRPPRAAATCGRCSHTARSTAPPTSRARRRSTRPRNAAQGAPGRRGGHRAAEERRPAPARAQRARFDRGHRCRSPTPTSPAAVRLRSSRSRPPRRLQGSRELAGSGVEVVTDDGTDPARAAQLAARR